MNVIKITVGRLFNLGSYEHVRYELTVEVKEGESARNALIGVERILEALAPESKSCTKSRAELKRDEVNLQELHEYLISHGPEDFRRRHGSFTGTSDEYIARCEQIHGENVAKRDAWEKRSEKARWLLNSLGGASTWTDSKLKWENDDEL